MDSFAPCPHCGGRAACRVTFSWWGGLLGPRLLHHVRCPACGATFNGRTGRSNDVPIALYVGLLFALLLSLLLLVAFTT